MSVSSRIVFTPILLIAFFLCSGLLTRADSVPITGTGGVAASESGDGIFFGLNGPSFSVFSSVPGGPYFQISSCMGGTVCDFTYGMPANSFDSEGEFDGQYIAELVGSLTFAASAPVPILGTSVNTPVEFILPLTVTGDVAGYLQSVTGLLGSEAFDYAISGSGTATMDGVWDYAHSNNIGAYTFETYSYNFSGVAETPELSTWLYLLTGFLLIFVIRRTKFCS